MHLREGIFDSLVKNYASFFRFKESGLVHSFHAGLETKSKYVINFQRELNRISFKMESSDEEYRGPTKKEYLRAMELSFADGRCHLWTPVEEVMVPIDQALSYARVHCGAAELIPRLLLAPYLNEDSSLLKLYSMINVMSPCGSTLEQVKGEANESTIDLVLDAESCLIGASTIRYFIPRTNIEEALAAIRKYGDEVDLVDFSIGSDEASRAWEFRITPLLTEQSSLP